MRRKILIHAGFHKTGTSVLQHAFFRNRENLEANGICYPVDESSRHEGHHFIACRLSDPTDDSGHQFRPEREIFCPIFERPQKIDLAALAKDSSAPTILLSSEIFSTFGRSELDHLRTCACDNDLQVHLYFRSRNYLKSVWETKVRWGYRGDFGKYLQNTQEMRPRTPVLQAYLFLDSLAEVFGTDPIQTRSYDNAMSRHESVVGDYFQEVLDVQEASGINDLRLNEHSAPEFIELNRGLNICSDELGFAGTKRFTTFLWQRLNEEAGNGPFSMAQDLIADELKEFEYQEATPRQTVLAAARFPRVLPLLQGWEPFQSAIHSTIPTKRLIDIVLKTCGEAFRKRA